MYRRASGLFSGPGGAADAFEEAVGTVARALDSKRIGVVVAARVVAVLDEDHGLIEGRAARILEACSGWLEETPGQVTAFGGAERGHVSVLARFPKGGSCLVSVGIRGEGEPVLGIGAWGSLGALAWESSEVVGGADPRREAAAPFRDWLREALQSGRTVFIKDGRAEVRGGPAGRRPAMRPVPVPRVAKPTPPPYGVLLVAGDRTHQEYFGPTFAKDPRCRVVGMVDEAGVSPERREQDEALARRMEIPVLPRLDEALWREDVHIVSIVAEPSRSAAIIERAAKAGKHLYLDNLVADRLEGADRLSAAIEAAGVVSQTWGISNTVLADRMRSAIRAGKVGEPTAVHQDYIFARAGTYPFAGPEGGPAELGRSREEVGEPRFDWLDGARREMASVGSYALVRLLSLMGRRVRRVRASTGNYFFRHHQVQGVEDLGQILMEFQDGSVATLTAGLAGNAWHPTGEFDVTYIAGPRGGLMFDGDRPRVEVWAGSGAGEPKPPTSYWFSPIPARKNDDIGRFLEAVASGRDAESPAWRAAEALEILIAAYRSAASGEVVELPVPRAPGG